MGIQRADVLYLDNGTTVDSGSGADIRLLSGTNPGSAQDQTATATHTQDNQSRCFDPATSPTANTSNILTTLTKLGWALRLTEDMTPGDDTNCNTILKSGTIQLRLNCTISQSGGTYATGTYSPTFRASLWRYDPSVDTGVLIIGNSNGAAVSWTVAGLGADLGEFKQITINLIVSDDIEFSQGEILLLQVGLSTETIPNPTLGTATWTYTLRNGDATNLSAIDFASGQGIRQACAFSESLVGRGVANRVLAPAVSRDAIGKGNPTFAKATVASKTFDVTGMGVAARVHALDLSRSVIGQGTITMTRGSVANKTFDLAGQGVVSRVLGVGIPRSLVGKGDTTSVKASTVSKIFSLVGRGAVTRVLNMGIPRSTTGSGVATMTRATAASKAFDLIGSGTINRVLAAALSRSSVGSGVVSSTKASVVSKVFDLIGRGTATESRSVQAQRSFSLGGYGSVARQFSVETAPFSLIGTGVTSFTKAVTSSKSFTLIGQGIASLGARLVDIMRDAVGKGVVTEVHPVQAFRTFGLEGKGEVLKSSSITIPIDEVPEEGGGGTIINKIINYIFDD